jgi:hypothetical protein
VHLLALRTQALAADKRRVEEEAGRLREELARAQSEVQRAAMAAASAL